MQIRDAVSVDALAIAEIHVAAWRAAYRGIVPAAALDSQSVAARESYWREVIEHGEPSVLVAVSTQVVVGWVAFGGCRDAERPPQVGELWAIYVSPQRWSTGIGRALWLAASERLRARGFRSVALWVLAQNERACRFYQCGGFRPNPAVSKTREIGGVRLIELCYEASIAA